VKKAAGVFWKHESEKCLETKFILKALTQPDKTHYPMIAFTK
jgi:hypothetical protein